MFPSIRHMLVLLSTLVVSLFGMAVLVGASAAESVQVVDRSAQALATARSQTRASQAPTAASDSATDDAAATPTPSTAPPTPSATPEQGDANEEVALAQPGAAQPVAHVPDGRSTTTVRCNGDPQTVARLRAALESSAQRNVSVAVHDFHGKAYCGYRDSQPYVTASIVKVATVASLMVQRHSQGRRLSSTEARWAKAAITISDNSAQQSVWKAQGSSAGMRKFMRTLKMTQSAPSSGGQWGLTTTTARDQVLLLDAIAHGTLLSSQDRDQLLGWMRQVASDQRWGVPEGSDAPRSVAVKNGWLPYSGVWRVNSIGWVSHESNDYTMAVLSTGGTSFSSATKRVATAAKAVNKAL